MPAFKNRTVLEVARDLRGFLNLEVGLIRGPVPNLEQMLKRVQSQLEQARNQAKTKDRQLAQTRRELSEKARQLARVREQRTEDRQLARTQHELSEKERQLAQAQEQLSKKDQQLAQAREQLSKRDQQLNQAQEHLLKRDQQLARAQEQFSKKDQQFIQAREQFLEKVRQLSDKDRQIAALRSSSEANVAASRKYVAEKYGYDNGLPVVDLLDLLPNLDETVAPYSFLEGQALPSDMALLKGLTRMTPECRYFEIGAWRGESIANVASVARECISLSLPEEELKQLGFTEDFIGQHYFYSGELENVRHIEHNSRTFDFSEFENRFDLVFVDGDHSQEGVAIDTKNVFQLLKDDQSAIVWHDYGFTPERVNWPVLAGILDGCPEDKQHSLYHVSNTLCAVYLNERKKLPGRIEGDREVSSNTLGRFQTPNKTFEVKLAARRMPHTQKHD